MRIYYTTEGWMAQDKSGIQPLHKFCEAARIKQGITPGKLQTMMGVNHPTYYNFESGKNKKTNTGLVALEALGYQIFILGGGQHER